DIDRLALRRIELGDDLLLVAAQLGRDGLEELAERRIVGLRDERLGPVECQIEMTAAVVDLTHIALRGSIVLEHLAVSGIERARNDQRPRIARLTSEVLDGHLQREKLSERVPAQVPFLEELLHMLR